MFRKLITLQLRFLFKVEGYATDLALNFISENNNKNILRFALLLHFFILKTL